MKDVISFALSSFRWIIFSPFFTRPSLVDVYVYYIGYPRISFFNPLFFLSGSSFFAKMTNSSRSFDVLIYAYIYEACPANWRIYLHKEKCYFWSNKFCTSSFYNLIHTHIYIHLKICWAKDSTKIFYNPSKII